MRMIWLTWKHNLNISFKATRITKIGERSELRTPEHGQSNSAAWSSGIVLSPLRVTLWCCVCHDSQMQRVWVWGCASATEALLCICKQRHVQRLLRLPHVHALEHDVALTADGQRISDHCMCGGAQYMRCCSHTFRDVDWTESSGCAASVVWS